MGPILTALEPTRGPQRYVRHMSDSPGGEHVVSTAMFHSMASSNDHDDTVLPFTVIKNLYITAEKNLSESPHDIDNIVARFMLKNKDQSAKFRQRGSES